METIFSIDFKKIDGKEAFVPVMDRGFLYGDSIYEAVRTYRGRLFLLKEHFERLENSASRLSLKIPFTFKELENHLNQMIAKQELDFYIRIIVTRGEDSQFDLNPSRPLKPKTIVALCDNHEYPSEFYTKGISLAVVSVRRNSKTSLDPEIKSGNYLNNILAVMEAKTKGFNDALMINERDHVTECTTSNFFIVKNGIAITPKLDSGLLHGVTRQFLLQIMLEKDLKYREDYITPQDVYNADEAFITATTKEIMPVRMCDDNIIGKGAVGPVTQSLMKIFSEEALKVVGLK